ncbi:MAG: glycosyltransferase [Verrucomicrobiia bacterium]
MKPRSLRIVMVGLSITSSWGNGHATTYRGLAKGLWARGHKTLFLERDQEWYASNRDLPNPPYCQTALYSSVEELKDRFERTVREADLVVVGSYVPEGAVIGQWVTTVAEGVTAFYDIDTPVTLAGLQCGDLDYLARHLVPRYQLYLSFTGGPVLERIQREFGSPRARALYCSADPALYYPDRREPKWHLGYLGTYSDDRQPALEKLLLDAARAWPDGRFVVAGPQYPPVIRWPRNVERVIHLAPGEHRGFYAEQRFTLNITRREMIQAGYSPSVRLFEAAACGTPIISDYWDGLETLLVPGEEILISHSADDTLRYLRNTSESERVELARRARQKVLDAHTSAHRAAELEGHVLSLAGSRGASDATAGVLARP